MSQRSSSTETGSIALGSLEERLMAHPQLFERIEALLNVVENSASDIEKADEAEQRVIAEVRQIGQQALSSWAHLQHQKQTQWLRQGNPKVRQHTQKNSTGTLALEP
jgi:hypothetical protein